ncbi:MAG: hypothetical protein WCO52_04650 [bacterium]
MSDKKQNEAIYFGLGDRIYRWEHGQFSQPTRVTERPDTVTGLLLLENGDILDSCRDGSVRSTLNETTRIEYGGHVTGIHLIPRRLQHLKESASLPILTVLNASGAIYILTDHMVISENKGCRSGLSQSLATNDQIIWTEGGDVYWGPDKKTPMYSRKQNGSTDFAKIILSPDGELFFRLVPSGSGGAEKKQLLINKDGRTLWEHDYHEQGKIVLAGFYQWDGEPHFFFATGKTRGPASWNLYTIPSYRFGRQDPTLITDVIGPKPTQYGMPNPFVAVPLPRRDD